MKTDEMILLALGSLGFMALLLCLPLITTAIGAFIGWVVSCTFLGTWVVQGFGLFGVTFASSNLYQIGAALGFVGGFFRAYQSNTNNSK